MDFDKENLTLWNQFIAGYDNILITTDLEPDDLIALMIIFKFLDPNKKVLFLVGEGNATVKSYRMREYIKRLNIQNKWFIVQSYGSEKDFPFDGYDVFNEEDVKKFRDDKDTRVNHDVIKQFIKLEKTAIISLKPPRELIQYWKEDKYLFKDVPLIGYMSFNLRCLRSNSSQKEIIDFLHSFKKVVYYETFLATGLKNSIDKHSGFPFDKLPPFVVKLIDLWNTNMIEECQKENTEKYKKILENILADKGQFVNADCALIVCLLLQLKSSDLIRGKVSFDKNNHTIPVPDPNGNVIFINPANPSDRDDLLKRQMEFYCTKAF